MLESILKCSNIFINRRFSVVASDYPSCMDVDACCLKALLSEIVE